MNKVIVLGHHLCDLARVEGILMQHGLSPARPSARDGYLPDEITNIICRANKVCDVTEVQHEYQLNSVVINPLWNNLVADLLVGNVENDFWGWADTQILPLLRYWHGMDLGFKYVLIYSHPQMILRKLMRAGVFGKKEVNDGLVNWYIYNKKMLDFYNDFSDECVLVEEGQVFASTNQYLKQLKCHIDDLSIDNNDVVTTQAQYSGQDEIGEFLEKKMLLQYRNVMDLYDLLQKNAHLPGLQKEEEFEEFKMWESYSQFKKTEIELNLLRSEIGALKESGLSERVTLESVKNKSKEEVRVLTQQLSILQTHLINQVNDVANIKEQNKKMISESGEKIVALQVEVEHIRDEKSKLQSEHERRIKQLKDENVILKKDLENKGQSSSEYELVLSQLYKTQEELQKSLSQNDMLKNQLDHNVKFKSEKQMRQLNGAVERVKRDLPYQLGLRVVDSSKSIKGLVRLPTILIKDLPQLKKVASEMEKLPSLELYADYNEAERVKRHLSYRVGNALVLGMKSPSSMIKLPWVLGVEFLSYKKQSRKKL